VVAYFDGTRDADRDPRGRPMLDDDLLIVINGWWEQLVFTLPDVGSPRMWQRELDTLEGVPSGTGSVPTLAAGASVTVGPRSLVLLKSVRPGRTRRSRIPATL
jgi:glycogen operon protein